MPSSKKKGSKKKKNSSAKGKRTAPANADGGGAELPPERHADDELFGMGHESYLGECSICALPLPLDAPLRCFMWCCTKIICQGCALASQLVNKKAGRVVACAFCREPISDISASGNEKIMTHQLQKRVDAGDAHAINLLGHYRYYGQHGLPKHVAKGIELWKKAARLGDVHAHYNLAISYRDGNVRGKKDTEKMLYHYEVAAIGGQFEARYILGILEVQEERMDRALRHFMISAKMGHEGSLKCILEFHKVGGATKDNYAQALLGYQKATEEMRSGERDDAKTYFAEKARQGQK